MARDKPQSASLRECAVSRRRKRPSETKVTDFKADRGASDRSCQDRQQLHVRFVTPMASNLTILEGENARRLPVTGSADNAEERKTVPDNSVRTGKHPQPSTPAPIPPDIVDKLATLDVSIEEGDDGWESIWTHRDLFTPLPDATCPLSETYEKHAVLLEPNLQTVAGHTMSNHWPAKPFKPDDGPVWFFKREHLSSRKTWQLLDWSKDHSLVIVDGALVEKPLEWDVRRIGKWRDPNICYETTVQSPLPPQLAKLYKVDGEDAERRTLWMPIRHVVEATIALKLYPIIHMSGMNNTARTCSVDRYPLESLDSGTAIWNATACIGGLVRDPPYWRLETLSTRGALTGGASEFAGLALSLAITGGTSNQPVKNAITVKEGGRLVWFIGKGLEETGMKQQPTKDDLELFAAKGLPIYMIHLENQALWIQGQHLHGAVSTTHTRSESCSFLMSTHFPQIHHERMRQALWDGDMPAAAHPAIGCNGMRK
ncbi:hypothetical protein CALCODRAFT_526463 [Calocera cornea HHB12733]|uniref:Uncharacterized protein n=1 Tax=Calocera cornea HHB12733 TaxID=1353952 RepID=A0A165KDR7_9BASI|nr:hypothetical protein CALCODRAFT_513347 [Calocera cornea HHB12733]KZT63004.1 hypothetical protein CALCODRAFT_526463 [Calocera cornea HHB12733]